MYRIAVLTNSRAQEAFWAEQILQFCAEHCLFPQMDCYHDQESFFEAARCEPLTNAVIALPGVDGLNAVEHLNFGTNKVKVFREMFGPDAVPDEFYSDNMIDLPMMKLARRAYLVHGNHIKQVNV